MKLPENKYVNILAVIVVYALSGITTVFLLDIVLKFLGVERWSTVYFLMWPLFIFPMHQALTVFYGFFLGKSDLFWGRQKKVLLKIASLFSSK